MGEQLKPSVITIFGVTGDLAERKVLPALYHLLAANMLPEKTYIVGTSRRAVTTEDILERVRQGLKITGETADESVLSRFGRAYSMLQLEPDIDADYDALAAHLQSLEDAAGEPLNRLFYLSVPPQVYSGIVEKLGQHGLNKNGSRLLVEKPFGYDLTSAEQLIANTAKYFDESQIFRIDHYLAKETAQNILTFRKQNPLWADSWNRKHIARVSITATESIDIQGRTHFYDSVGALRDLIQSHLIQLLALTIMDIPADMSAAAIHANKQRLLESIHPVAVDKLAERAVRGQYAEYREQVENPGSMTETYASIVLYSSDPDWQDVPLRLTTGKALAEKRTSITVDFGHDSVTNRLQLRLQPNEGISITMQVKQPGLGYECQTTTLDFDYQRAFAQGAGLEAYERVLVEAIRGDHLLFATDAEVLAAWRVLQPLLDAWQHSDDLKIYPSGSDGPDTSGLAGDYAR